MSVVAPSITSSSFVVTATKVSELTTASETATTSSSADYDTTPKVAGSTRASTAGDYCPLVATRFSPKQQWSLYNTVVRKKHLLTKPAWIHLRNGKFWHCKIYIFIASDDVIITSYLQTPVNKDFRTEHSLISADNFMSDGKVFHSDGPATEKLRGPKLAVLVYQVTLICRRVIMWYKFLVK